MTDDVLDADVRALLDLGREQLAPDPATVGRLRTRIATTVAVAGAGVGVLGLAKSLGAKGVAVKLAVVATVGIAAGAAIHVVHVVRGASVAPAAPVIMTAPDVEAHEVVHPTIAIATHDAAAPRPSLPASSPPALLPPAPSPPAPSPMIASAAPPSAQPSPARRVSLARETELVELASHALRAGDLAAVRDAIAAYTHETGGAGQLAEDIDAIEIEALCGANDPSASTKLAAFDVRWPHAGQRHRLVAACQGDH
jgi:hypothetical protein